MQSRPRDPEFVSERPFPIALSASEISLGLDTSAGSLAILNGISIDIRFGEILGIIGPNGCGKSTLLRVLSGLQAPTAGQVIRSGDDINVGMIFQHVQQNLVPWRSTRDNVALPALVRGTPRQEAADRAISALKAMDLDWAARRYPNELSGGQEQLISLARWFANPPSVLLVDEGWSMLDLVQREKAYGVLANLARINRTAVVVVSHNIGDLAATVDRAIVLTHRPANVASELCFDADCSPLQKSERLWQAVNSIFAIPS